MNTRGFPEILRQLRFIIIAGVLILSFQLSDSVAATAIDKNHVSCTMCHRTMSPTLQSTAALSQEADLSEICMDCHHYTENHHPVNFVPEREIDSRYPLIDGQIKCLTCHEAHGKLKKSYPKLLRGAPYEDRREMCFRCHSEDQHIDINPHRMINSDGTIRDINGMPSCLFCHGSVPDQSISDEQITFKADVAFLCWRCHPPMPGEFFRSHYLVKPSRTTERTMKSNERQSGINFPLLNRDRITCSTCHNPHQLGVIQKASVSSGADATARLRVDASQICLTCHSGK
jgi:predicted CXXCH cytochrome family protein